jgi:HSP20 family protein
MVFTTRKLAILTKEASPMTTRTDPLSRLQPLSEDQIRAAVDQQHPAPAATPLAYDVFRIGDELVIAFDVPGSAANEVELEVDGPWLTVRVRRGIPQGANIDVVQVGRPHGSFSQRLLMGDAWNLSAATAVARDGVLEVRTPIAVGSHRRRVTVDSHQQADVDSTTNDDDLFDVLVHEADGERVTTAA